MDNNELLQAFTQLMTHMLDEKLQPIKTELECMQKQVMAQEKKLDTLNDGVDFVRGRVVVMENDFGQKIGLLLDGHAIMNEKLKRLEKIENKVDDLAAAVDIHDIKLTKLAK